MSVQLVKEPETTDPAEGCCLCGKATRMWNPDNDVAICTGCAADVEQEDLPTKSEWFQAWAERNKRFGGSQMRRNILT